MKRGPLARVVSYYVIGKTRHGPRWRFVLACGHQRDITDGTECRPDVRNSHTVDGVAYLVPTRLVCQERVDGRWCDGGTRCQECKPGKRKIAVRDGLCALHASRARKAACTP